MVSICICNKEYYYYIVTENIISSIVAVSKIRYSKFFFEKRLIMELENSEIG